MTSSAGEAGQDKPTKISFVYSNPTDPADFEAAYPEQLALARKLPGLTRLHSRTPSVSPRRASSEKVPQVPIGYFTMVKESSCARERPALVLATIETV
jgi:hypothetical protein